MLPITSSACGCSSNPDLKLYAPHANDRDGRQHSAPPGYDTVTHTELERCCARGARDERSAAQLAAIRAARPDLTIVAILPRTWEDGPYMRTFRLADGGTAMLRRAELAA